MFNDDLKFAVKKLTPQNLELHGVISPAKTSANGFKTYICPICGNGTGSTGDGLVVYDNPDGYAFHCYRRGCHFDNISLLALYYNLDARADFPEILKRAASDFGLSADFEFYHNLTPAKIERLSAIPQNQKSPRANEKVIDKDDPALIEMIQADIAEAQKHLEELPESQRRGLTLDTLKFFNCGFLREWQHPNLRLDNKKVPKTRRLIIPAGCHYNAVLLPADRTKANKKFWKMHAGGKKNPFGLNTIDATTKMIMVFEGEIDAMSMYQVNHQQYDFLKMTLETFEAEKFEDLETGEIFDNDADFLYCAYIAILGAAETKWLDTVAAKCAELNICPRFVIVLDNDEAGRESAEKQVKAVEARGFSAIAEFLPI